MHEGGGRRSEKRDEDEGEGAAVCGNTMGLSVTPYF